MDATETVLLVAVVAAALGTGVAWRLLMPRLAEPATAEPEARGADRTHPVDAPKLRYHQLATRRHGLLVAALSALATAAVLASVPLRWWPAWLVLSTIGVLLAVVDGYTTCIPASVTRVGWAALAVAIVVGGALSGDWTGVVRGIVGGLAAGLLFGVVWLIRHGFGFGDVRFVILIGGSSATLGWTAWAVALLAGCLACALHGGWRRIVGRTGDYPWAPSLLVGCLLTTVLIPLLALTR